MYHLFSHNDLDGVGCGIVAKIAFGDNVEIRYNSVSGLDFQVERFLEQETKDTFLFITDLSVNEKNEKALVEYTEKGGKAKLIDHHKTALHFNNYHWGSVTIEYEDGRLACATSLFYDYLSHHNLIQPSNALDKFVELVRQYDTWEWDKNNNVEAKRLNDLFFMISIEEFEERMIERITKGDTFTFDDFEEKILNMEEDKIERYIRKKRRELVQTFIDDYCVGIVHAESYHSELGNELGKENSHLDYIAILNVGGKRMSLRTIHDEIDVSEIANKYGGGGHAKASGCSMNELVYKQFVEKPFTLESIRLDAFKNRFNLKASENGSLYLNNEGNKFFIYPDEEGEWKIEWNGSKLDHTFTSFEEAEKVIKRNHFASLARDEAYIDYLVDGKKKTKIENQNAVETELFFRYFNDAPDAGHLPITH